MFLELRLNRSFENGAAHRFICNFNIKNATLDRNAVRIETVRELNSSF